MRIKQSLFLPILLITAGVFLAACGSDSGESSLDVSDTWARSTAPGQETGAIYATITGGTESDRLVGVKVPADVAGTAEIHESSTGAGPATGAQHDPGQHMNGGGNGHMESDGDDHMGSGDHMMNDGGSGMMSMKQVEGIDIPADGSVSLEPGGFHIMLFDLAGPLRPGDAIPVTLSFEHAGEIKVDAEVRGS